MGEEKGKYPRRGISRAQKQLRCIFPPSYLSAESQVIAKRGNIIFQQVNQALVEVVVLTFHICVPKDKHSPL